MHVDQEGNEQNTDYQASSPGGCYTQENIVYMTQKVKCGGSYEYVGTTPCYNDETGKTDYMPTYRCKECGDTKVTNNFDWANCSALVNKQVDSGKRYYTLNCGKTTDSIETATIIFN